MRYRLPVGEDDFAKVRQEYYFVDKSPFIREFMDRHGAVTLFARPRRFGKTLTLSMFRYFFDIDHAEENRDLFEGLAIARDAEERGQWCFCRSKNGRPTRGAICRTSSRNGWEVILIHNVFCWTIRSFPQGIWLFSRIF